MKLWKIYFGCALDLLLGDPPAFPHPVVCMGRGIEGLEPLLRAAFPDTPMGELAGGAALAGTVPLLSWEITSQFRRFPGLELLWCWQVLALRGLGDAGLDVYRPLCRGDLDAARTAVGRMVGRDTEILTEAGVVRAAVESVAENFCDGVAAPLLALFLGGVPLAMACKAVNTLDSMTGYRTDRYEYFGKASAKLDDAVNFLPARIAALCWIGGSVLTGQDGKSALRIWLRDRRKHPSPNAGQTESACAGALGLRLGGPARYFGRWHRKPFLGEPMREAESEDILRAVRTLYAAAGILLAACTMAELWRTGRIS